MKKLWCERFPSVYIGVDPFNEKIQIFRCCIERSSKSLLKEFTLQDFENILNKNDLYTELCKYVNNWPANPKDRITTSDNCPVAECFWPKSLSLENIFVSILANCNLHCQFCGTRRIREEILNKNKLSYYKTLYYKVLESLKGHKIKVLTLTELGEPLFFGSDFQNFISNSTSNDFQKIEITTNGTLLTKDIISSIKKSDISFCFNVSLNAWDKESYIKIMGNDFFYLVLSNVFSLLKIPNVSAHFNFTYNSKESFYKIKKFAEMITDTCGIYCHIQRDINYTSFEEMPETI